MGRVLINAHVTFNANSAALCYRNRGYILVWDRVLLRQLLCILETCLILSKRLSLWNYSPYYFNCGKGSCPWLLRPNKHLNHMRVGIVLQPLAQRLYYLTVRFAHCGFVMISMVLTLKRKVSPISKQPVLYMLYDRRRLWLDAILYMSLSHTTCAYYVSCW